jgi:signal transduction histidine kinase
MTLSSSYPGIARYLTGTVVLSTIIAAAITAFGSRHHGFGENFVYSQCIGTLTYASIDMPRRLIWPSGLPPLLPMFGLAVLAAPVGWFGGSFIASILLGDPWDPSRLELNAVLGFLALTAGAGIGGSFFFLTRERLARSESAAVEARLKLLQAQIEPHFLFNTLANLQALIGVDPARAQDMLRHLDGYLRATLATTRNDWDTLAEEFALLQAYLEILAIRMGPRLAYGLDLPQALADATLPPMLLQPLVENAIRHGLEPTVEGGKVRVSARQEGRQLVLVVQDTGQGFGTSPSPGTGVGLAHVRERLAAVYGNAASIETGENEGGGVSVTLRLPLQKWTPAPSSPKTNRCSPTA